MVSAATLRLREDLTIDDLKREYFKGKCTSADPDAEDQNESRRLDLGDVGAVFVIGAAFAFAAVVSYLSSSTRPKMWPLVGSDDGKSLRHGEPAPPKTLRTGLSSLFSSTHDAEPTAPAPAAAAPAGASSQAPPASAPPSAPASAASSHRVAPAPRAVDAIGTERDLEKDGSWRQTAEPLDATSEQLTLTKTESQSSAC